MSYATIEGRKFNISTTDAGNIRVNVKTKARTGHVYRNVGIFPTMDDATVAATKFADENKVATTHAAKRLQPKKIG